jgi:hypothetical protein
MINVLNAETSIVGIVLAVVANIVVGMIWYNPKVMGTKWADAIGKKMGDMKMVPSDMAYAILAATFKAFVLSLLIFYGLTNSAIFSLAGAFGGENPSGILIGTWTEIGAAIAIAFLVWVGFVVPTEMNRHIWENKNLKLFWINSLHMLVTLVVMALVIVFFLGETGF